MDDADYLLTLRYVLSLGTTCISKLAYDLAFLIVMLRSTGCKARKLCKEPCSEHKRVLRGFFTFMNDVFRKPVFFATLIALPTKLDTFFLRLRNVATLDACFVASLTSA